MTKTRKTILLATLGIIFILALVIVTVHSQAYAAEELTGYYFKVDGQVVNGNTIQLRRGQTSGNITYWHDGVQQSATLMIMPQTIADKYLTLNVNKVTASKNTPLSYTKDDTLYIVCFSNGIFEYLYIQILPANVISIVNTGSGAFTLTASGIDIQNINGSLETVSLAVQVTNAIGGGYTMMVTANNNGSNLIDTYVSGISGYYLSGNNTVKLVFVTYTHEGKSIKYDVDSYTPILFGTTTSYVYTYFEGGNGSVSDPYTIKSSNQLNNIRNVGLSNNFKLISDINFVYSISTNFKPIPGEFQGTFDGNGKKITNIVMSKIANEELYGLFERIGVKGTVKNLSLEKITIVVAQTDNSVKVGGIAGINYGTISDCTVYSGELYAEKQNSYVGGIVGGNQGGTVSNCKNYSEVTGCGRIGGIVGMNAVSGAVTNCTNYGPVQLEMQKEGSTYYTGYAGGIVGRNSTQSTIKGCTNQALIIYGGEKNLSLQIEPYMAQIVGWMESGSQTENTFRGSVNYKNLYSYQSKYCSDGAVGKQGS